ncbi:hypothetical protein J8273_5287 [Carpediemonas membranifera]|uniref:Uncharacterized protein n=1 Tax=Carpediemonas membranifera TaxID=201153 RepID=A0A8J6AZM8_9EUKA|nr:hypothetical protein J8273_5287 [Carpediemonas membranifera]|eukprot:KAG9392298.1 hypothetical protein J8273_5287 [Carpediemonas membranifera]
MVGHTTELLTKLTEIKPSEASKNAEFVTISFMDVEDEFQEGDNTPPSPVPRVPRHYKLATGKRPLSFPQLTSWPSWLVRYAYLKLHPELKSLTQAHTLLEAPSRAVLHDGIVYDAPDSTAPSLVTGHGPVLCATKLGSHILSAHATGLCLSAPNSSSSDDRFVPVELTGARMLSVHKNTTLVAVARVSGVSVVDLDTSNASYLPVRAHIAAFSPDGSMIAMATASGVWLHSLRTARRSFFPTQRPITAMVWIESALVMAEHECTTLEVAVANPKTLVLSPIGGLGLQPVALGGAVLGGAVTNLVYADKVLHVTAGIRAGGRAHASLISMVVSIDAVPRGVVIRAGGTTDRVWGDVVPQLSAAPGVLCYLLDGEVMSVDVL